MKTTFQGFYGLAIAFLCSGLYSPVYSSPQSVWLECPKDVTISCETDISDLDRWGKVWIWENYVKREGPKPKTVIYNTNACGIGQIIRKWEYEDKHWNMHYCEQVITITGSGTLFGYADITWPKSLELEGCNPNADPKNLPKEYAYPRFLNKKCSQPMYSYKDMKFTVADGCMKILREWKVIDWCQYVPNKKPEVGLWSYTQVIKLVVKDSSAYLKCPKDTVVDAKQDCKGAFVKLDSAFAFSKCGPITKIRNTSIYAHASGPDASGTYPIGTSKFYFIAEYGCGQEIKCEVKVTVVNKIGPTPYCLTGVIVALMPLDTNRDGQTDAGMIEVWAKDLDRGSFHKCGQKNLIFSFSKDIRDMNRVFTCDQLGKNDVEIWVTDSSGNQSFCKTMIEIQNNNARIPDCKRKDSLTTPPQTILVSGLISTPDGKAMPQVCLELQDPQQFTLKTIRDTVIKTKTDTIRAPSGTIYYIHKKDTQITVRYDTLRNSTMMRDTSKNLGQFSFINLTKGSSYELKPQISDKNLKGLDANDAVILLKHLLGTQSITDPFLQIAADMNQDKIIDFADFNILYGLINGTVSVDQMNSMWRMIPKRYSWVPGIPAHQQTIDEMIKFPSIQTKDLHADFVSVKLGDLDWTYVPQFESELTSREKNISDSENSLDFEILNLYPNPVSEERLILDLNIFQHCSLNLKILDMAGKPVFESSRYFETGNAQWIIEDISRLEAGIYLYQLRSEVQSLQDKLMVIK